MCQSIRENDVRALVLAAAEAFGLDGPVYRFESCLNGRAAELGPLDDCLPRTEHVVCRFGEGVQFGRLPFPDGSARTVLWLGALDGVFDTQQAVVEMQRILAPGGALLICTPANGPAHEGNSDPSQSATCFVQRLLVPLPLTLLSWPGANAWPHTVYALGFKPPITAAILRGISPFLEGFPRRLQAGDAKTGWWDRLSAFLKKGVRAVLPFQWRARPTEEAVQESSDPFCGVQFAIYMSAERALDDNLLKAWLLDQQTGGRLNDLA